MLNNFFFNKKNGKQKLRCKFRFFWLEEVTRVFWDKLGPNLRTRNGHYPAGGRRAPPAGPPGSLAHFGRPGRLFPFSPFHWFSSLSKFPSHTRFSPQRSKETSRRLASSFASAIGSGRCADDCARQDPGGRGYKGRGGEAPGLFLLAPASVVVAARRGVRASWCAGLMVRGYPGCAGLGVRGRPVAGVLWGGPCGLGRAG